ncbi:hypothetical protein, partial [Burkholderia plantarii]|uniref:hypothetical protein n=1 Tax=Burkholderia plantarii TaxID=41899 RepID=UPI001495D288
GRTTSQSLDGQDGISTKPGAVHIAQLATAIDEELHRSALDALRPETLELQQTRLRRLRDEIRPSDARAIARHTAHFGRVVREHHAEAVREMQSAGPTR